MTYYAAFLDLKDRRCIVLGGGAPAVAKVRGVLEAGAEVVVFAAEPAAELEALPVELVRRDYQPGDLIGVALAIDASEDEAIHQAVSAEAQRERVLLNVVDRPELCTFIAPSVVKRGSLQVAISTGGESPFLATSVRDMIAGLLGGEWGPFVSLVGNLRRHLRAEGVPMAAQMPVYRRLLASNVRDLLRAGDSAAAEAATRAIVTETLNRPNGQAA